MALCTCTCTSTRNGRHPFLFQTPSVLASSRLAYRTSPFPSRPSRPPTPPRSGRPRTLAWRHRRPGLFLPHSSPARGGVQPSNPTKYYLYEVQIRNGQVSLEEATQRPPPPDCQQSPLLLRPRHTRYRFLHGAGKMKLGGYVSQSPPLPSLLSTCQQDRKWACQQECGVWKPSVFFAPYFVDFPFAESTCTFAGNTCQ